MVKTDPIGTHWSGDKTALPAGVVRSYIKL